MAGKVKKKDDGLQSKTARASLRSSSGAREGYTASGDAARILPLGGGTHAYLLDPRDGRTLRLSVSSESFVEVLSALVRSGHGERVRRDLADLVDRYPDGGWKHATARLEAALAEPAGREADAA